MKTHRFIISVSFVLTITAAGFAATLDPATEKLYQKIDSLFVIASSGEVKYRDMVELAIDAIAKIGAPAVPPLIDKLDTQSARDRLTIISILTKIGSPAVPKLVEALGRPSWLVVQRVCWALGDIKDSVAIEPLKKVSVHPNWQVREYSVRAMGNIGSAKGLPTVLNAFSDSVGAVRKAAVFASGQIKHNDAIPKLVEALGDDFYGARFAAMEALVLLDTSAVIEKLKESTATAGGIKANMICQTLGKIGRSDALEILNVLLDSENPGMHTYAAIAIVSADPTDHCGYYVRIKEKITERLALVQIESARKAAQNASQTDH